jgi:hypothetical protein
MDTSSGGLLKGFFMILANHTDFVRRIQVAGANETVTP